MFYFNVLLCYVCDGCMGGFDNVMLCELGVEFEFFFGVIDFFECSKVWVCDNVVYQVFDIKFEYYIVSIGLMEMIKGLFIVLYIDGVWGCEFLEVFDRSVDGWWVILEVIYVIDNIIKMCVLFEINKGVNKYLEVVSVNLLIVEDECCVLFVNMIYVVDGLSDILVFFVVCKGGVCIYVVYNFESFCLFEQVDNLCVDDCVDMLGLVDYWVGLLMEMWLKLYIGKIVDGIVYGK